MPDKLFTTRELVDHLQLDRVTIYMVKDGELPALRVGGQWRFSEAATDVWLRGPAGWDGGVRGGVRGVVADHR